MTQDPKAGGIRPARGRRPWGVIALLLAAGAALGIAGAFVQAHRGVLEVPWGVLVVPWGVPLVWIALLAGIRGGAWLVRTRWGAWSVLLGWLSATVILASETPSGDVALSGGVRQTVYLLGGVVLASAAASLPLPRDASGDGHRDQPRNQPVS